MGRSPKKRASPAGKIWVFTNVDKLPEGTNQSIQNGYMSSKWDVIKRKPNGSIEKYKAGKVGRDFTQEHGVNYDETYAQIMRLETLKILLIIPSLGRAIRQWGRSYIPTD